jgi:hypothetical protein
MVSQWLPFNQKIKEVKMNKVLSMLLMFVWGALAVQAQQDTSITQSAEFEGDLKIRLRDAGKISSNPSIIEQKSKIEKVKFQFLPTAAVAATEPEKITASKINVVDKVANLQNGYVVAGMGNYVTPMVDAHYSSGRNRNGDWGVNVYHLSSAGGVVPDSNAIGSGYSDTRGALYGRYFLKNASVQATGNYWRNISRFYGHSPASDSIKDILLVGNNGTSQNWQTASGSVRYDSFSRDSSDMNYHAGMNYQHGWGKYGEKESVYDFTSSIDKLVKTEVFAVDWGVKWNNFQSEGYRYAPTGIFGSEGDSVYRARKQANTVLKIQPSAYTVWKDLRVKVGMGVFVESNSVKPAHFYPMLEMKWSILDGLFLPYAGVKGGVELNTFHALMEQNPFIISNPRLLNRNNKFEAYGGINGVISSKMGYEAGVNWNMYENQAFFVNDASVSYGNRFNVLYDNMRQLDIHGRFFYREAKKWEADAAVHYLIYDMDSAAYAWNMPKWKGTVQGAYFINESWKLGVQINYIGDRYAYTQYPEAGVTELTQNWAGVPGQAVKLRGFVDANLQVRYQYNPQIAAWANVYNTVAQRYQMWNGYNQQRVLFMMGAAISF